MENAMSEFYHMVQTEINNWGRRNYVCRRKGKEKHHYLELRRPTILLMNPAMRQEIGWPEIEEVIANKKFAGLTVVYSTDIKTWMVLG
jgi:hypothetical protein